MVPTDFTVDSLLPVKHALHEDTGKGLSVVLFHGIYMDDSITERLMFSKARWIEARTGQAFREACEIIRNTFSARLHSLRIELFVGDTDAAFRNFVEGLDAKAIYRLEDFEYKKPHRQSRDLRRLLDKAPIPVLSVNVRAPQKNISADRLVALFTETVY